MGDVQSHTKKSII